MSDRARDLEDLRIAYLKIREMEKRLTADQKKKVKAALKKLGIED